MLHVSWGSSSLQSTNSNETVTTRSTSSLVRRMNRSSILTTSVVMHECYCISQKRSCAGSPAPVCASGQQPQPLSSPKRATDRHRDGWTTQNYSSTGIWRINISCKNTPSGQEQKNQQVHRGATGGRHIGFLFLEPVFLGIISSSDFCTWISICGFSDGLRVEGPPFDVFINMYCLFVKCATK